jgi:hypothetical protein
MHRWGWWKVVRQWMAQPRVASAPAPQPTYAQVVAKLNWLTTLVNALGARLEEHMSVISEKLAVLRTEMYAAKDRILEDTANYEARIAALQKQVDEGTATAADIALLDELTELQKGLDPTNPNVLPPA